MFLISSSTSFSFTVGSDNNHSLHLRQCFTWKSRIHLPLGTCTPPRFACARNAKAPLQDMFDWDMMIVLICI